MSYEGLLPDRCTIQNRTLDTSGKTKTETWTAQTEETPCRALFQAISRSNPDKTQNATAIRSRFALPKTAVIAIRDRISHDGRIYDVIHVTTPFDAAEAHHKVAICEAVAGAV